MKQGQHKLAEGRAARDNTPLRSRKPRRKERVNVKEMANYTKVKAQEFQRTLYLAAKENPKRRFHACLFLAKMKIQRSREETSEYGLIASSSKSKVDDDRLDWLCTGWLLSRRSRGKPLNARFPFLSNLCSGHKNPSSVWLLMRIIS